VVLQSEGGHTVDQGGPTNYGVTQRALSAYLGRAASVNEVMALTPVTVAPLYQANYWNPAHCNYLPAGVDLMVFDEAVNEGVGRAVRHLQTAVGVVSDGQYGEKTDTAVKAQKPAHLIQKLHDLNATYYDSLASIYPQDEKGWHARNDRTMASALSMARQA
jgi:lysozyme family protein